MPLKTLSTVKCFGGVLHRVSHASVTTKTEMIFAVFLPPQAETSKVPALFYLSGLTCTDENFTQKAGAQRAAAEHGIALIAPDTSPRALLVASVAGHPETHIAPSFLQVVMRYRTTISPKAPGTATTAGILEPVWHPACSPSGFCAGDPLTRPMPAYRRRGWLLCQRHAGAMERQFSDVRLHNAGATGGSWLELRRRCFERSVSLLPVHCSVRV
jgi:hypothetical protein